MKTYAVHFAFRILICFSLFPALHAEDSLQITRKNVFLKTSPIKNKVTITLSNSLNKGVYNASPGFRYDRDPLLLRLSNFRIEANYGLLSCLQIGGYFGYSNQGYTHSWTNGEFVSEYAFAVNYGGQINFHPLGLFLNRNRNSWDLWMGYKYGRSKEYGAFRRSAAEDGWGGGVCYFPFKKQSLGFHFEYSSGNWQLKRDIFSQKKHDQDFRWGISYKFGK